VVSSPAAWNGLALAFIKVVLELFVFVGHPS